MRSGLSVYINIEVKDEINSACALFSHTRHLAELRSRAPVNRTDKYIHKIIFKQLNILIKNRFYDENQDNKICLKCTSSELDTTKPH